MHCWVRLSFPDAARLDLRSLTAPETLNGIRRIERETKGDKGMNSVAIERWEAISSFYWR